MADKQQLHPKLRLLQTRFSLSLSSIWFVLSPPALSQSKTTLLGLYFRVCVCVCALLAYTFLFYHPSRFLEFFVFIQVESDIDFLLFFFKQRIFFPFHPSLHPAISDPFPPIYHPLLCTWKGNVKRKEVPSGLFLLDFLVDKRAHKRMRKKKKRTGPSLLRLISEGLRIDQEIFKSSEGFFFFFFTWAAKPFFFFFLFQGHLKKKKFIDEGALACVLILRTLPFTFYSNPSPSIPTTFFSYDTHFIRRG